MQTLSRNRLIGGIVLAFAALLFVPAVLTPEDSEVGTADLSVRIRSTNPLAKNRDTSTDTTADRTEQEITDAADAVAPATHALQLESFDSAVADTASPKADKTEATATITRAEDLVRPSRSATVNSAANVAAAKPSAARVQAIKLESFDDEKPSNRASHSSRTRTATTATTTAATATLQPSKASNAAKQRERWIRVGSFSDLSNADNLAQVLKKKRYSVKIENVTVSGKAYRRVLLGPFTDNDKMQKVLRQISAEGFAPSVQ